MDLNRHSDLLAAIRAEFELAAENTIKSNTSHAVFRATRKNGTNVIVKTWLSPADDSFKPILAHRALNLIRKKLTHTAVPTLISDGYVDQLGHYVVMSNLEGTSYPWDWSSTKYSGGRALSIAHGHEAIRTLKDLQTVVSEAVSCGLPRISRGDIYAEMRATVSRLLSDDFLSEDEGEETLNLLRQWSRARPSKLAFSNSDFRHANMMRMPNGQTGLVDWDDARLADFEIAHAIAHCWIFLWNNQPLQEFFVTQTQAVFEIERSEVEAMILYRAALQLRMSRHLPERVEIHRGQILSALRRL